MPGPPPSRNPRRTNKRPEWRTLPAAGRTGDPPAFPLGKPTKAIAALWVELWSSPQAAAWESLGWTRVVARYAKLLILAERRDATAALLGEVRQLEDRLGLSPMAMRRLQWEIAEPTAQQEESSHVADLDAYRARLG